MKRKMLITPEDLIKFMGAEKYRNFINEIIRTSIDAEDYEKIKKGEAIWIEAQW